MCPFVWLGRATEHTSSQTVRGCVCSSSPAARNGGASAISGKAKRTTGVADRVRVPPRTSTQLARSVGADRKTGPQVQTGRDLRLARRIEISLAGADHRALHQDLPGAGEETRIPDPRFRGQLLEKFADVGEVLRRGAPRRVAGRIFQQNLHERAAVKSVGSKPIGEEVERREQPLARRARPPADLRLQPLDRPQSLPLLEEGSNELLLRAEMMIEGHLGDARALDNRVDSHVARAALTEELVCGREPTRARGHRGRGSSRHKMSHRAYDAPPSPQRETHTR